MQEAHLIFNILKELQTLKIFVELAKLYCYFTHI